jgi:hypothetical protein
MKTALLLLVFFCRCVSLAAKENKLRVGVTAKPKGECESARTDSRVTIAFELFVCENDESTLNCKTVFSEPSFTFTLGRGQIIEGMELGLTGVCKGEERKMMIPSGLGYGDRGAGDIPPRATLLAKVRALDISL